MNDNEEDKSLLRHFREDMRLLAHYLLAPVVLAMRLSCIGLGKLADWVAKV